MTDSTYLAAIYLIHGATFRESAKTLGASLELKGDGTPKSASAIPFYFLASHCAELYLKAALLKCGFSEQQMKNATYRHNLNALLTALQDKGVSVTSETVAVVTGLYPQHQNHALRYTALVDDGQPTYMP